MKEILLHKENDNGRMQFWKAEIDGATYTITHGLIDGKKQVQTKTVRDGKNEGKINYTSPANQAEFQVANKARKKVENNGYEVIKGQKILDENRSKETQDIHEECPKPMLAHKGRDKKDNNGESFIWIHTQLKKKIENKEMIWVQPKLDGFRSVAGESEIYTRKRKLMTGKIPHLLPYLEEYHKILKAEFLDGEAFSPDVNFNEIQSILNKKAENMTDEDREIAKTIRFNLFDYISDETQDERMKKLLVLKDNEYVKIVKPKKILADADIIQTQHDEYVGEGHEGLMIRFLDAKYENKRSHSLLKWKVFDDAEATIIDMEHEKNNPEKLGKFICKFDNGVEFKARPKVTKDQMDEFWKNKDKYIGTKGTIIFQGYLPSGKPRFPRFKGIRADDDILDEDD